MSEIIVSFPDFPDVPVLSNMQFGDGHWLVNIENWFDGVGSRNENDPRPDEDGDFDQDPVYSEARYPIVTGRLRFPTEAAMFAARKPFAKLGANRQPFTIQVQSLDGIQTATVVRNGKVGWDMSNLPNTIEFEIPLKAADPRKYGPLKSKPTGLYVAGGGVQSPLVSPLTQIGGGDPGQVTLTNDGSTDTIPQLTVSGGGLSGGVEVFRVSTRETLRLEWPILASDVVRFDFGEGQVWLNDQSPITGYLTRDEWWTLGAGETAVVQFIGLGTITGTPTLTAEWKDAD